MPNHTETDSDSVDRAALKMMLSYVEAECLRIGATEAAHHAALAAAMMPGPVPQSGDPSPQPAQRRNRLH
ncbi:hypothetical protein JYK14_03660 [Siccirubricoccus sp. KC 17139]|uniref:Uncharacterized protein n=1 Tax=Siccirubricoccus soli TaxID=2899147 RepID=A0ABT1D025_9PROT|nr:hypothetical protein [Siccirubricoccus soli]MCO6415273.1 hypothetical protein [Siccirubricoccus soli]MCP2681404.1 hypothetical protein [Siccirubricoccus soli]